MLHVHASSTMQAARKRARTHSRQCLCMRALGACSRALACVCVRVRAFVTALACVRACVLACVRGVCMCACACVRVLLYVRAVVRVCCCARVLRVRCCLLLLAAACCCCCCCLLLLAAAACCRRVCMWRACMRQARVSRVHVACRVRASGEHKGDRPHPKGDFRPAP